MHHKYALVDCRVLLTGSFNWTRAASRGNVENVLVTSEPQAVNAYARQFDLLWRDFTLRMELSTHAAAVRIQSISRGLQARGSGGVDGGSRYRAVMSPQKLGHLRRTSTTQQTLAELAVVE